MKRSRLIPVLTLCLLLSGCGGRESSVHGQTDAPSGAPVQDIGAMEISRPDVSGAFSSRDMAGSYDESAAIKISLTGDSAVCDSGAVNVSGSAVTIGGEGVYLISGS